MTVPLGKFKNLARIKTFTNVKGKGKLYTPCVYGSSGGILMFILNLWPLDPEKRARYLLTRRPGAPKRRF